VAGSSSSSSSSSFVVTCPGCAQRLRFALDAEGPARVRLRCAACGSEFGVRRPGIAPIGPGAGGSGGTTAILLGVPAAAAAAMPAGDAAAAAGAWASAAAPAVPPPLFAPETMLAGRYRVVRFLAQGGMGEVYEVEDQELRERVALKTVRPEVAVDLLAVERFRREIQLARKVTHPNVCRIFDVFYHRPDSAAAAVFLTMELLDGESLAARLRRAGPLPPAEALNVASQICRGLDAAHQAEVIHRDLKPANVLLVPTRSGLRAVVTDFGLARLAGGHDPTSPTLTMAGGLVGTPAYLAPEQLDGGEISTAVDIYALGIVLYEIATGTVPFLGDSVLATAVRRLKELPVSPRVHAPDLDPRWESTILRCLERHPAARFATPLAVLAALTGPAAAQPPADAGAPGWPTADLSGAAAAAAPPALEVEWAAAPPAPEGEQTAAAPPAPEVEQAAAGGRRRSTSRLLALVALVLVAIGVGWYRYAGWRAAKRAAAEALLVPSDFAPRRSVAVLGFRDLAASPATAWLSPALAEMLSSELAAGGALRVIGGEEVTRVEVELRLGQPDSLARDTLARLRTLLGSDSVVVGSYLIVGTGAAAQVRLDLRLQDALTGATTAFTETGSQAGLFQLVSRAGDRLRRELRAGAAAGAAQRAEIAANPEAAAFYAEGMQKLRLFDPVAARDLLSRAVAADPGSALAHSGLATAWATLGFDDRAAAQAKTAYELSAGLPEADRLLIEGRYREATGGLGAAVDIYRRLRALYPDSLDYGLRLADAEIAAGHPQEALLTVASLRTLPAPSRDDPRLDLAEATAAGARSDFARQHATAAAAAEHAGALGASLLVAQARQLDCLALRSLGRAAEALAACAESQRLHAAAGDRAGVALALTGAANVHFDRGDLPAAQALYEQALATDRELGSRGAEAGALNNIAVVLRNQGDLERARQLFEQVLAIARELGSHRAEANSLNNLAGVLLRRGDLDAAGALYQQSLALWRSLGDAAGAAYVLDNLGVALRRRGDLTQALAREQEALAIRQKTGHRTGEAASLNHLAAIQLDQGALADAARNYQLALTASRAIGSQTATAAALYGLGEVAARAARWDEARRDHQQALDLRTTLGEKLAVLESRLALADLDLATAGAAAPAPPALGALADRAEALAGELAGEGGTAEQAEALSIAALAAGGLDSFGTRAAAGGADARRAAADIELAGHLLVPSLPAGAVGGGPRPAGPGGAAPGQAVAVQDLRIRLTVILRTALLRPPAAPAPAAAELRAVEAEAVRSGLEELRLQAALALAERAGATSPAAARQLAADLQREAAGHGYTAIAQRAAALAAAH
jgi:tetratricopeptide (TPR) repeat protein/tRNA A-37 threonylcarbamoyl transferase component Bud32